MKDMLFFVGIGFVSIFLALSSCGQPYVATQAAGPVTTTNATLAGMVTPRGLPTLAWFEWGTDGSYGQTTSLLDAGSGTNVVRTSAVVDNLIPDSVYRCRLVASNSAGITYGWERRFTTGRRVASWGDTVVGPLGSVLPPANLGSVVSVVAGDYQGLALKADGTVVNWGRYYYSYSYGSFDPPPNSLSNVMAIAGGRDHSLAITSDGAVVAWGGYNGNGQTNVPTNLSNVVAISAGDAHSLALQSDGRLAAWGDLASGSIPAGLSNVVAISSGDTHWLALRNNGTVARSANWSVPPPSLSGVVAIAAGYMHDLALKTNGTVVGWGNGAGATVPAGLSNVVAVAAGDFHSLALKSDGTVVVWGTAIGASPITPPIGLSNVMAIACGDEFCMALGPNTPPQATPRTSTGPVNRDLVLSLMPRLTRDPNGDPLTLRIVSLPASGFLFQFASGVRGEAIVQTNTPVSDASGNVIFAPGLDEFGAPYTIFSVVANDGEYDSVPSLATVNIVPAPSIAITGPTQNFQGVVLSFTGLSNASYTVYRSTDLINWSPLQSASQPLPGQFSYSDVSVANQLQRFYRIRSP